MAQRKVALITGSTDGLGRSVATRLAAKGYVVLIHGRNRDRGERLVQQIEAPAAAPIQGRTEAQVERQIERNAGRARFYEADFGSLAAVRDLAQRVQHDQSRLDLLINNAGIGIGTGGRGVVRDTSAEGYELRFAVNYLAGFLLTRLLLPLILGTAPARIINVASAGQYPLDFGNLMLTRAFSGMRAYAQSKLAQVMFTFDLARELEGTGVTVNCLHPATYMDTTMVHAAGVTPLSTVEEGAEAVMRLAVAPELATSTGLYFDGTQQARAHAQAYDANAREQLAAVSRQLTGLEP